MNPPRRDNLRLGALNAVGAAASFAATGACIKAAADTMPNEVVVFFRNAVALLLLLPWLARVRLSGLRTRRWGGHLLRATFGTAAMYCFFYSLAHLNLAEAVLLNYSAPLYIPLIAWIWIQERPPWIVLPVSLLGLGGIALIAKPSGEALVAPAALVGAASGFLAGLAMVSLRRISATEPTPRIIFFFALISTLISSPPAALAWITPSPFALAAMIGGGLFATIGQVFLTRAYSLAPAARVGAVAYSSVVFAALIGWLLWGETPDRLAFAGGMLVIAACLLASWTGRQARPAA